jgi:hypothetical protein
MNRDIWLVFAFAITIVLTAGCGKYEDDIGMLCNAEARWQAAENPGAMMDPGIRRRKMFAWAEREAKTGEGKKTVGFVAALSGSAEKAKALREEAAKAKVSPCPLAESLEKEAGSTP